MTKEEFREYIKIGNEIEFNYKGKQFSITYGGTNGEMISFCEFYKMPPTNVGSFEELCEIEYKGEKLLDILASLTEDDIWIF